MSISFSTESNNEIFAFTQQYAIVDIDFEFSQKKIASEIVSADDWTKYCIFLLHVDVRIT